ncbi:MAG: hypothetical protein E7315_02700 [Clostridiales bacterium]|nr:hypothetical protein [Clostridiales bacterium]
MDTESNSIRSSNTASGHIVPVLENNGMLFLYNGSERIRLKNNIQRISMSRDKSSNMHFLALTNQNKLVYICTHENGKVFCERVILVLSSNQRCPYFISGQGYNDVFITFCIESSTKPMKIFSYKYNSGAWRQVPVLTLGDGQAIMVSSNLDKNDRMTYCIHDVKTNRLLLYSLDNDVWSIIGQIQGNNDYLHSENIHVEKGDKGYLLLYSKGNINVKECFSRYESNTDIINFSADESDFSVAEKPLTPISIQENNAQISISENENLQKQIDKLSRDIEGLSSEVNGLSIQQGNKAFESELQRISKEVSKQYKLSVDIRDKIKQHEQQILKANIHVSELENRLSALCNTVQNNDNNNKGGI